MAAPAIPLARAADAMLAELARSTGAAAIAALDGRTLLGERAAMMGFRIPGRVAAGGGCRLIDARAGTIALNLARPDDRDLLPALFEDDELDGRDDAAIASCIAARHADRLVARGRELGLAIAASEEGRNGTAAVGRSTPCEWISPQPAPGLRPTRPADGRPRVLDLSALWAGPLAAHLLRLAGADVLKVESPGRPDAMRQGQPAFHAVLNQGKASVALDPRDTADRAALLALIGDADIVIEASRPRALAQHGIDAAALVRARPGLVWLTITAHGLTGEAANWVGFGDDVGVAAGLSAAVRDAAGRIGFVGDAIADPLTGIAAARAGWQAWSAGRGGRIGIAMVDVVARALESERARDPAGLVQDLRRWADSAGAPFPSVRARTAGSVRPFGIDPPRWRTAC